LQLHNSWALLDPFNSSYGGLKHVFELALYYAFLLLSGLTFILTCNINSLRSAIITNSLCLEEENGSEQILKEAKEEFEDLKEKFLLDPSKYSGGLNPNSFKPLINGLFQSEGLLSIYFQAFLLFLSVPLLLGFQEILLENILILVALIKIISLLLPILLLT